MYAQRGHGKRSSFYSDYTFGAWPSEAGTELVPVGKAYSGFTDEELHRIDRWVRDHTVERYGPVRAVAPQAGAGGRLRQRAPLDPPQIRRWRMRFPRIHRIRWDKPAAEADTLRRGATARHVGKR